MNDQVHVPTQALLKKIAPRRPWWVSIYIPALARGLLVSIRQFFKKSVTIQYPEQKAVISERFRGEHYLKKDEHGHMKCVACYMCATACPANCITIEAEPAPQGPGWEGRDKVPLVFDIDMLKCIYCGYCVEACPTDAITHGHGFELATINATNLVMRKEDMLTPNQGLTETK